MYEQEAGLAGAKPAFPVRNKSHLPINGATTLLSLPQKLASPLADPRTDAGNASGVHPYNIALNELWTG